MQYGVLPGGGSPKRRHKKSPVRVFGSHIYNQVRRPSRFRGRLIFTVFGVVGVLCLIFGRQSAVDLSRTASSLKDYLPTSVTEILEYGEFEEQRWDDHVDGTSVSEQTIKKPKFHLLIPAGKPTAKLCKTLLSAAILNYPPPTLISYTGQDKRPGSDIVRNTYKFLNGKEAHEDDLVIVVEEDAWFQLPADITISRFFHGLKDSNEKLDKLYSKIKYNNTTDSNPYTIKVLFGSTKECSNGPEDPACISAPASPLPKDIYGDETDKHTEGKYNRPKYISSATVMGRVADLRAIHKEATYLLESTEMGKKGSQQVFAHLFGLQEKSRSLALKSAQGESPKWISWLSSLIPSQKTTIQSDIVLEAGKDYELGIGLDYISSIFQTLNNSIEDIRFVEFNHPSIIALPSRISSKSFKNPIRLSEDLVNGPPPYSQDVGDGGTLQKTQLDNLHDANAEWHDLSLSTNVIVPGSSVPASLNFHGSEDLIDSDMWGKMWFYPDARALMRQHLRSTAALRGWDVREGKGGAWRDDGTWVDWGELCGDFDEIVFGDGKGRFMREKVEDGGVKGWSFWKPEGEKVEDNSTKSSTEGESGNAGANPSSPGSSLDQSVKDHELDSAVPQGEVSSPPSSNTPPPPETFLKTDHSHAEFLKPEIESATTRPESKEDGLFPPSEQDPVGKGDGGSGAAMDVGVGGMMVGGFVSGGGGAGNNAGVMAEAGEEGHEHMADDDGIQTSDENKSGASLDQDGEKDEQSLEMAHDKLLTSSGDVKVGDAASPVIAHDNEDAKEDIEIVSHTDNLPTNSNHNSDTDSISDTENEAITSDERKGKADIGHNLGEDLEEISGEDVSGGEVKVGEIQIGKDDGVSGVVKVPEVVDAGEEGIGSGNEGDGEEKGGTGGKEEGVRIDDKVQ